MQYTYDTIILLYYFFLAYKLQLTDVMTNYANSTSD